MKKKQVVGIVIIGIVVVSLAIGTVWVLDSSKPMDEALEALISDESVEVDTDEWISFTPAIGAPTAGFIFYPGGKVEPESYAPLARAVAEAGYLVVIAPMPLNLAVLSPNAAEDIIAHYTDIETWAIGGHSLGGTMAAKFVFDHPGEISALILLAAYPADSNDLSDLTLEVLSIYGSNDGVLDVDIPSTAGLLPSAATFVEIDGGNHAQFGYYGDQKGDLPATISREQQHQLTVNAILTTLGLL